MFNNTTFTNSTNGTGPGPRPPTPEVDIVAIVFFCILALMIVFVNSLTIGAFYVNTHLRTTTNLLLLSLAIADVLTGAISVPLWVYLSTYPYSPLQLHNFYLIFDIICSVSSILNLTIISLERCHALLHPINHRNITKRVVLATISVTWILAALAGSMRGFLTREQSDFYVFILTVVFFFVPLAIILGAYGTIFHIARAHARGRGVSSFKKELRIATTVAVVIGLFVICWTPFFAINFAFTVCVVTKWVGVGCTGLWKLLPVIIRIIKWLQYGNSVCNPIIYGVRNKDFRRTFRKILMSFCCKNVRLSNYRKSLYEQPNLQRDPPNQVPLGLIDRRESQLKAIQRGRDEPMKLEFSARSLPDGLSVLSADVFHSSYSTNDLSASPVELCNLAFEGDQTETGIYPIDQEDTDTRL